MAKTPTRRSSRLTTRKSPKKKNFRVVTLKANIVEQPPETALTRKGLSLKQLLRTTDRVRRDKGQYEVTITKFKKTKTKTSLPAMTAIARHKDPFMPNKTVKDRNVYIIGLDSQTKPVTKQKRVMVSCDCVTGNTRVLTDQGWKTIYSIAGDHEPGHYPMTYMIKGKPYPGSVPYYKGKQKTYTLTLSNGNEITATGDHKFLVAVPRGSKNKWKKLKNLDVKDRLLLNTWDIDTSTIDKDSVEYLEMFLLGMMMGDGSFTDAKQTLPELRLYGKKTEMAPYTLPLKVVKDQTFLKKGQRLSFNHRMKELLHRKGYSHKQGVDIENVNQLFGYLSGLVVTDGKVSGKNGDIEITGEYSYLKRLQEYCFQYGLANTRLKTYPSESKGSITNYGARNQDLWHLTISANSILPYYENLLLRQDMVEKVDTNRQIRPSKVAVSIDAIYYSGRQDVYDITVPGPTRFVVEGNVFAHNCEDFVYHGGEYACTLHGAARIIYGNGEPPTFTNPGNVPYLCKHLVGFAHYCMDKGL